MISIPDNLPEGVSRPIYDWVSTLPKSTQPETPSPFMSFHLKGLEVFLETKYPITLEDGTIIHGCMIGANNSRVWIITVPPQGEATNAPHGS